MPPVHTLKSFRRRAIIQKVCSALNVKNVKSIQNITEVPSLIGPVWLILLTDHMYVKLYIFHNTQH